MLELMLNYYCKGTPKDEEISSACNISKLGNKPVCLFYEETDKYDSQIQMLMIHPGDEVADILEKLKIRMFVQTYC